MQGLGAPTSSSIMTSAYTRRWGTKRRQRFIAMVSETGRAVVAHGVAFAAEAVKGLRSPSLAPINSANYKTVRCALDCLPRYGWKVYKGSCAPRLKTAPDTILFKPVFCPTIGERLTPRMDIICIPLSSSSLPGPRSLAILSV